MTRRLYLDDSYLKKFSASINSIRRVSKSKLQIVLDQTVFRPSEGGQDNDTGVIKGPNGEGRVDNTTKENDSLVHHVQLISGRFLEGERVNGILDWERRLALMRSHTGQHILARALQQEKKVRVKRVHIHPDQGDIILESTDLPWNTLLNAEKEANDVIWNNKSINIKQFRNREEVSEQYGTVIRIGLKNSTQKIRVVDIDGFDTAACTGSHLKQTGDVYLVKIQNLRKQKDELKINYVVQRKALEYLINTINLFLPISNKLTTSIERIPKLILKLEREKNRLFSQIRNYSDQLLHFKVKEIWNNRRTISNVHLCSGILEGLDQSFLFKLSSQVLSQDAQVVIAMGITGDNPLLYIKTKGVDITLLPIVKSILRHEDLKGKITPNFLLVSLHRNEKPSKVISDLVEKVSKTLSH